MNKASFASLLLIPFVFGGCLTKTTTPAVQTPTSNQPAVSLEDFNDIDPAQVTEQFTVNGEVYAIVQQPNVNTPLLLPEDVTVEFVGVLKESGDNTWVKVAKIEDITEEEGSLPKNNPIAVWEEKGAVRIAVVDQTGAGSGEGVFKIFVYKDNRLWVQESCGYYDPSKGSFLNYDERVAFEYYQYNSIDRSYQSGPTFLAEFGEERMVNEPACDNVFVSVFTD